MVRRRPTSGPEGADSAGETPPRSRRGRDAIILLIVAVSCVALAIGYFVSFALVAGEPYDHAFVERRDDGYYLGLRDCEQAQILPVTVSRYDENASTTPPPVWTTSTTSSSGTRTLKLFAENPGFRAKTIQPPYNPTTYEIVANRNTAHAFYLTADLSSLEVGQVDYGGWRPMTLRAYEELSNNDFGC